MNRISMVAVLIAGVMPFTVGCATKKYTREQAAPIINKTNELDDLTAKNSRDIKDTDRRAQAGATPCRVAASSAPGRESVSARTGPGGRTAFPTEHSWYALLRSRYARSRCFTLGSGRIRRLAPT